MKKIIGNLYLIKRKGYVILMVRLKHNIYDEIIRFGNKMFRLSLGRFIVYMQF